MAMSSSEIVVGGVGDPKDRRRIELWARRAAEALELPSLEIVVRGAFKATRGLNGGVLPDGTVWIRRSLLRGSDERLGFFIYEEAAHRKLMSYGVDDGLHTFLGVVLHELYACWFQYHQFVAIEGKDPRNFVLRRLGVGAPTPSFAYELGGLLGPALAGNDKALRELRSWHESGKGDPALEGLSRRLQALQPYATDPVTLGKRLAQVYGEPPSTLERSR
jgi:hypothetical protein